jgi:threonine dehydrogenase-like Zn-dependent dehydrogenase
VNRTLDLETREKGAGFGVTLPHISGADPCGEVVAVGAGVTSPHVGQRVAVSPMLTCGACPMCRRGTENACLNLKILGVHRHGGYVELVRAPAGNALRYRMVCRTKRRRVCRCPTRSPGTCWSSSRAWRLLTSS